MFDPNEQNDDWDEEIEVRDDILEEMQNIIDEEGKDAFEEDATPPAQTRTGTRTADST